MRAMLTYRPLTSEIFSDVPFFPCCFSGKIMATAMARWPLVICRRWMFDDMTKAVGSSPTNWRTWGATPATRQASRRLRHDPRTHPPTGL